MASFSKTSLFFSALLVSLLVAFSVIVIQWSKRVRPTLGSSSGLKGGGNSSNTGVCLVSLIDVEEDDSEKQVYNQEQEVVVCNPVSGEYDTGVDDVFLSVRNLAIDDIMSNQEAMLNSEWFIEYSNDWIQTGHHHLSKIIVVPDDHSIVTIDPSRVTEHNSVRPQHRRKLFKGLAERQRRLKTTIGERTVVVVAIDLSMSRDLIYNHVFGKKNSLQSQMAACSWDQVTIIPHPEHPVITVTPDQNPSKYTFVELYTAVLRDIKRKLDVPNGESVTSITDHLMLIVPDSIDRRPGELGWGATPGFFAGIIESLVPSTMTMLHEIGHNFGLGHAYEDNVAYSDMSTVMGYSHRDVVKMCYNGQNMWDMDWFPNRRYDIRLRDNSNDREIVDVAFYGDYNKTTSSEPVVVRYKDVYMTFNRKRWINRETKEYPDMLLVVQEIPGEYHPHTNLETALAVGSKAHKMMWETTNSNGEVISTDTVFIEVCSYTAGDFVVPDVLKIAVGRQPGGCPHLSVASNNDRQNNRGNALITPEQPLECRMQFPWVEITNSYYDGDISYPLCQVDVKNDPEKYCELEDGLSQMPVWKICRLECPVQSNCGEVNRAESFPQSAPERDVQSNIPNDECRNLKPEVEINILEDDSIPSGLITKSCEELEIGFLQTRKYFCDKVDAATQLKVADICKVSCPGNYCSKADRH